MLRSRSATAALSQIRSAAGHIQRVETIIRKSSQKGWKTVILTKRHIEEIIKADLTAYIFNVDDYMKVETPRWNTLRVFFRATCWTQNDNIHTGYYEHKHIKGVTEKFLTTRGYTVKKPFSFRVKRTTRSTDGGNFIVEILVKANRK